MIEIGPDDTPTGQDPGHSVLLVRRYHCTGKLSYYRCRSTAPADLADLWRRSAQGGGSKRTSVPRSPWPDSTTAS